ncbi:MAG: hypothetical protein V2I36_06740 [Desulfopila sp.]|jgi:hypothetical protein|nr:hypothetical protein [Desulfopila sp.]
MSQNKEFERLEKCVEHLLDQHKQLLEKNSHLQSILLQKEEDIRELQSRIHSADSERGDISSRIKGLIDQIEEWQSSLPESDDNDLLQETEQDNGDAAAETGETESKVVSENRKNEERELNQQRSLFHVERRIDVDSSS